MQVFLLKYWKQIAITLAITFILIYIWYRGKAAGESGQPKFVEVPQDIFSGSGTLLVDSNKVRRIATELHNDMEDGAWWLGAGHEERIYEEFAALSDSEFVSVYNDFNERYFSEGEGTLWQWIDDEVFAGWTIIDDVIMPKMARLNLN